MNKRFLSPLICCCSLLFLTSCASNRFATRSDFVQATNSYYIATHEVSVGDWIAYILSTSFTEENTIIALGDHPDKMYSKLPVLEPGTWSSYTINAFLRRSQKNVSVDFYTECKHHIAKVAVAKCAWDSIQKYHLLDVPMVGITYEQAMDYITYKQDSSNSCVLSKEPYRYEYFLPSPEQFDAVQTIVDSINSQECNLFNYKNSLCADCPTREKYKNHPVLSRTGKEPTYVWSYFPDPEGIRNFKGNVAEMTSVKGIAVGGSCMHFATEAFKERRQKYLGLAGWLGFRVWYRRIPKS